MGQDDHAQVLCELGTERLRDGHVLEAVELFDESIAVKPTAEGYTYRGWAVSCLGRIEEAIDDCRKAIRLDPDFGNPYNDIGAYLMQQGRLDEAIPWLETAKQAKRYTPRHFPYLNMGRIYLAKGKSMRALDEFVTALGLQPNDPAILAAIDRVKYSVN